MTKPTDPDATEAIAGTLVASDGTETQLQPGETALLEADPAQVHVLVLTSDVARPFIKRQIATAKKAEDLDQVELLEAQLATLDELTAAAKARLEDLPAGAGPVAVLEAAVGLEESPPAAAPEHPVDGNVHLENWETDAALAAVASHQAHTPAEE